MTEGHPQGGMSGSEGVDVAKRTKGEGRLRPFVAAILPRCASGHLRCAPVQTSAWPSPRAFLCGSVRRIPSAGQLLCVGFFFGQKTPGNLLFHSNYPEVSASLFCRLARSRPEDNHETVPDSCARGRRLVPRIRCGVEDGALGSEADDFVDHGNQTLRAQRRGSRCLRGWPASRRRWTAMLE